VASRHPNPLPVTCQRGYREIAVIFHFRGSPAVRI
jgi:hypothetical protein